MSRRPSLTKSITKMLNHLHTLIARAEDVYVSYDTDHDPPQYYFVLDAHSGAERPYPTARAAAENFVSTVGQQSATLAAQEAQAEARAHAARRRGR